MPPSADIPCRHTFPHCFSKLGSGGVAQRQEATDSKTVQCGFESHRRYFDSIRLACYTGNMNEKFGKEYHREYYRKRREAIFDYLGGRCAECGTADNLEVDHIDKTQKQFNISSKLSVKNNKEELDRCQLLCKTHHREKTAIENSGFTHGTVYGWMKAKCACSDCLTHKRLWQNNRNEKRRASRNV